MICDICLPVLSFFFHLNSDVQFHLCWCKCLLVMFFISLMYFPVEGFQLNFNYFHLSHISVRILNSLCSIESCQVSLKQLVQSLHPNIRKQRLIG